MSWIDRLNNIELEIETGDGKIYKPLWKNARKNINFNTEANDYIGVEGTYIERGKMQGRQFPILLYFQGQDCIEQARQFEISSRDSRPWKIKHTFYDNLLVQPLNLEFDDSDYNVSKVTGTVWETTNIKYPSEQISIIKLVTSQKSISDKTIEDVFVEDIEVPDAKTIQSSTNSILQLDINYGTLVTDSNDVARLKNLVTSASGAAQEIINQPRRYIQQAIALINFPFTIEQSITQKINSLKDTINDFASIFLGNNLTDNNKVLYEQQCSVLFSELSKNVINSKESDYLTRSNVLQTVTTISNSYFNFLEQLDNNEIIQNAQVSRDIDVIINNALARLFDIAFESKQERSYTLDKDDNIINLSHRFYGPGDDNIELFVQQNNIRLDEYLNLKKGRQIIYYV